MTAEQSTDSLNQCYNLVTETKIDHSGSSYLKEDFFVMAFKMGEYPPMFYKIF